MNKLYSPWPLLAHNFPRTQSPSRILLSLLFAMCIFTEITAQDALNRSVQVSATFETNPDRLEFSWPWDWSEGGFTIFKKNPDSLSWGQPIGSLPWGSTNFTDYNVDGQQPFEYAFFKKRFERITDTVQVTAGDTLVFTIQNFYGDGLCCNYGFGWYLVQACGQILTGGSDFGFEKRDTIVICGNGPPTEPLIVTINPDLNTSNTWWKVEKLGGQTIDSSGWPGSQLAERPKYGYILTGQNLPPTEGRGTILLLVDDTYTLPLQSEIGQLERDFVADGWKIIRQDVNRNDPVPQVKSLIVSEFAQTPDLKMLYLLGHVPVPYAGNTYPDGHIESHWGAWAADVFYGEMDGLWTDATVSNVTSVFPRNHNVPGDGKYDQSAIPTAVELAVGRVDLYDMPAFGLNDTELTRRYLNRAHQFKTGQLDVERRALVDNNLGIALGAPAASGWRNFAPMFTAGSVAELDYFSTMKNESYLWSFGGGSGTPTSANGIGNTQDFANDTLKNIFTMLCGSYFGDWDNPDNFLKAPLASPGWQLTSCWVGNPPFTFHRMAMGEPIGYSLVRTQNATETDYYPGPQLVHTALLGDPTLRLHPVKPVGNLVALTTASGVDVQWSPPTGETVAGYHVYRADSLHGDFVRVNADLVTDTTFTDADLPADSALYMVRAVKLETSGSGSYWNLSLGEMAWSSVNPCAGQAAETELFVSICEGQSFAFEDSTYTESGIYEHNYDLPSGCDSLVRIYLTVESSPVAKVIATICEGEDLAIGDTLLTETGTYHLVFSDSAGCLQNWTVHLTVAPVVEIDIDSNYIPPIIIGGIPHFDDFTISFTFTSSLGCDSIVNFNFHPLVSATHTISGQTINVYPNPSAGQFFIEIKNAAGMFEVDVLDGVGRPVFSKKSEAGQPTAFDAKELPAGVYFLKIRQLEAVVTRRLILMK
ncbi:MAG: T9SS type A sorting domain-containing protein [Bacteroidetes bacterium]|nr:T9SS type A sorting domain-containing protein [Bacteroidota bacterium]